MKRKVVLPVIVVTAVGLLALAGGLMQRSDASLNRMSQSNEQSASQKGEPNTIFIDDFSFKTKLLKVKKGTTVTWVNSEDAHHDITPDKDYGSAFVGSSLLSQGESYSVTFQEPGTYSYHCSPHPYMKATIEVTP